MNDETTAAHIRILIADDDEHILDCYRDAFTASEPTGLMRTLDALNAELFNAENDIVEPPVFDVTACRQGDDAVTLARAAAREGHPYDVVILDIRMPPGIDGVEAGKTIREIDPNVEIVFVSGYSDISLDELKRRIPPALKLHCFCKPLSFMQLAGDVASMVRP